MNKITSLFSVLTLCFCFTHNANAQVSTSNYEQPSCVSLYKENNLGKVTPDNLYFVSYHSHNNLKDELIITEISNPANSQKINLPDYFSANDMFIISEWVYLCGTYKHDAAIAKLKLVELYSPNPIIHISSFLGLKFFSKLEVYVDENDELIHIAAVGRDYSNEYLYMMTDANNSLNCIRQQYPGALTHLYHDVAVTNNYIVTAGITNMTNYFIISVTNKTAPNILNRYLYNETSTTINSNTANVETLSGDTVAVTTVCVTPTSDYFTRVYIFDAATSTILYSQDIPLQEKNDVIEMEYLNDTAHTLLLLQENVYPTGVQNSLFYFIRPFNTSSYATSFFYNPDSQYYSLDHFNDGKFLATGELKTGGHAYMIGREEPNTIPKCVMANPIIIKINQTPNNYIIPAATTYEHTPYFTLDLTTIPSPVSPSCHD